MLKVWVGVQMFSNAWDALGEANIEVIGPRNDPEPLHSVDSLAEADAAIGGPMFPGTEETFAGAPKLRVVARAGAGYDNIDVEAATRHGICVVNTPDANTESTAVYTIGMMINAVRYIKRGNQRLNEGQWLPLPEIMAFDLNGSTLGIIGLGRIGGRVAEIAHVLGMRVVVYDPYISEGRATSFRAQLLNSLDDLLAQADVVTLHVPLSDETRGMIGSQELAQMQPGAVLVNCSRGPVLVESALVAALQSGRLAAAALDVWHPEPPAPDNPLLHMDNVIATPHMAARTHQGQQRSRVSAVHQVVMALQGQRPPGLVNSEVWERYLQRH